MEFENIYKGILSGNQNGVLDGINSESRSMVSSSCFEFSRMFPFFINASARM